MKGFQGFETGSPLRVPFKGSEKISEFNSQAGQDIFTLSVLDGMKNGIFLDIGCNEPKRINNTFLMEEKYGWKGILIDFMDYHVNECRQTRSKDSFYICEDATKIDYAKVFSDFKIPGIIDYMSLDIDGIETLHTLYALPLDSYKIRVITFEHDAYRFGDKVRLGARQFLIANGYVLLCGNVKNCETPYEDWYVHPDLVDMDRANIFRCENNEWSNIIFE